MSCFDIGALLNDSTTKINKPLKVPKLVDISKKNMFMSLCFVSG